MGIDGIGSTVDIAVSGLRAQSMRMRVVASNIANANTSRTETGEPYRRQSVILSTMMEQLKGVDILQVVPDMSTDFKKAYNPGHPDADENGFVTLPNVDLPMEMIDLISASRAYGANAAVLKRYQESVNVTLELLK